jgi:hypothetical protein
VELEVIESESLVEWFANNYKTFGTTLNSVTARLQEGSQFCQGFEYWRYLAMASGFHWHGILMKMILKMMMSFMAHENGQKDTDNFLVTEVYPLNTQI